MAPKAQKHICDPRPLEDTPVEEIDESSYTHHASEQRQTEITENRHELVKNFWQNSRRANAPS